MPAARHAIARQGGRLHVAVSQRAKRSGAGLPVLRGVEPRGLGIGARACACRVLAVWLPRLTRRPLHTAVRAGTSSAPSRSRGCSSPRSSRCTSSWASRIATPLRSAPRPRSLRACLIGTSLPRLSTSGAACSHLYRERALIGRTWSTSCFSHALPSVPVSLTPCNTTCPYRLTMVP